VDVKSKMAEEKHFASSRIRQENAPRATLQFLRNNEIAALNVSAARLEVGEAGRDAVDRAPVDILLQIFGNQIE
jgi:hypothetical protein